MTLPGTLGELKNSEYNEKRLRRISVKDEMRENLITKLQHSEPFSRASSVMTIPSFRKSSTLFCRAIISFCWVCADRQKAASCANLSICWMNRIPVIAGSEINDNPYAPISKFARIAD